MRCGDTIRKLRKRAGMTQQQLATAINRCVASISLYEQGKRDMPASVMERIAQALHVPSRALWEEENDDDD